MRNFFIGPEAISGNLATLTEQESKHLRTVLRLEPGAKINLFDGTGNIYEARIEEFGRQQTRCLILATREAEFSGPALHLGQAILTGQKLDLIIQKATELGVRAIHPFTSSRCTVREINEKKIARWQRIALEACKQCGRAAPPIIMPVTSLEALCAQQNDHDLKIIFWEEEKNCALNELLPQNDAPPPESTIILIGPEGGFTKEEIEQAHGAGYSAVSLGKLTMRAETASISATAIAQYLLGNLQNR